MSMMAAERTRTRIDALAGAGLDAPEFMAAGVEILHQAVTFSAACVAPTDPATELITAAVKYGALDNSADDRWAFWEYEADEPYNFQTTARLPGGVTSTHAQTGGRPERSRRHAELFVPTWGFSDELRAALQIDRNTWGFLALFRGEGASAFTPAEQSFIASVAPSLARGLRAALITGAGRTESGPSGPTVIIVDGAGQITRTSLGADEQVADLGGARLGDDQLPVVLSTLVGAARAYASGRPVPMPRMRVRTRSGRWVVAHAAPMMSAGQTVADVVITIEAARPPEVIPLLVAAYGLTGREQSVVQLVLRGVSTAEIAATLHLSAYTVQDHLKAIFEKAGVRSRRELNARVFYDHYAPHLSDHVSVAPSGWFRAG